MDTFHFTFSSELRERVTAVLVGYFGEGEASDLGINTYHRSMRWELGTIVAWSEGRKESFCKVPGDAVAFLAERVWQFAQDMAGLVKCTRVDTYIDDHSRDLYDLDAIHAAGAAGNYFGARTYDPRRPRRVNGELEGDTAYFGRRGSNGGGAYTRVYDKRLESDGEENQIRHEVEWSKEKAMQVWEILVNSKDFGVFCQKAANATIGAITFVERGNHVHLERMKVLPWWQRVIDAVGEGIIVRVQRFVPDLMKSAKAWRKQWVRTLALLIDVIDHQGHDGEGVVVGMLRAARPLVKGWRRAARDIPIDLSELLGCRLAGVQ